MKILITGATGLVGTALTDFLLTSGHTIHVLSTQKKEPSKNSHLKFFYWNPKKNQIDNTALDGVQAVVHLAGAAINQRWTQNAKKEILESRVLSTKLLFDAVQGVGSVKHVVCASAIGVYPSHTSKIYTEKDTEKAMSFTGNVVQQWESESVAFKTLPLKTAIIRIGLVMSDKGGALVPLTIPTRLGMGAWFGNGNQWQSWIHIDDLVRAIDFLIQNKLSGVFNATAPEPVTQRFLVQTIAKTLAVPRWLPGIPKLPIRLVMGQMSEVLFDSIRVVPKALLDHGFKFSFSRINDCLEDLLRKPNF